MALGQDTVVICIQTHCICIRGDTGVTQTCRLDVCTQTTGLLLFKDIAGRLGQLRPWKEEYTQVHSQPFLLTEALLEARH